MYGSNRFGECMIMKAGQDVNEPMTVQKYIKKSCKVLRVIELFPGHHNTKIIAENHVMLFKWLIGRKRSSQSCKYQIS